MPQSIEELLAENLRLRVALEPFGQIADLFDPDGPLPSPLNRREWLKSWDIGRADGNYDTYVITIGMLRDARAALQPPKKGKRRAFKISFRFLAGWDHQDEGKRFAALRSVGSICASVYSKKLWSKIPRDIQSKLMRAVRVKCSKSGKN